MVVLFLVFLETSILFSRRRQWHPTPVLLPGKYHGQRSLEGDSSWGCTESDMTERLPFHFSLSMPSSSFKKLSHELGDGVIIHTLASFQN